MNFFSFFSRKDVDSKEGENHSNTVSPRNQSNETFNQKVEPKGIYTLIYCYPKIKNLVTTPLTKCFIVSMLDFLPYLYDFDRKKRVYKITSRMFLNDSEKGDHSIYFLIYTGQCDLDFLFQKINDLSTPDKFRCFVIVESENQLTSIQQGQTYETEDTMDSVLHNFNDLLSGRVDLFPNTFSMDKLQNSEYIVCRGKPMYISIFFRQSYILHNCERIMKPGSNVMVRRWNGQEFEESDAYIDFKKDYTILDMISPELINLGPIPDLVKDTNMYVFSRDDLRTDINVDESDFFCLLPELLLIFSMISPDFKFSRFYTYIDDNNILTEIHTRMTTIKERGIVINFLNLFLKTPNWSIPSDFDESTLKALKEKYSYQCVMHPAANSYLCDDII